MKNSMHSIFIAIVAISLFSFTGYAQDQIQSTHTYQHATLNSGDIGEAIVADASTGNYYTAGEILSNTNGQAIRVQKFNEQGVITASRVLSFANYKLTAKKILYVGSKVYVICNAVHTTSGSSELLVIKFDAALSSNFTPFLYAGSDYHHPEDAVAISNSTIAIACYKRSRTYEELAVVKINSSLAIINSYTMHYTSITDDIAEAPRKIINVASDGIYVVGQCTRPSDNKTATVAIKLSTSLTQQWLKKSGFALGKNSYNSVAADSLGVFVAGVVYSNGTNKWLLRRLNPSTGATLNSTIAAFGTGYTSEALKITRTTNSKITVVGYANDTASNTFSLKIAAYNSLGQNPVFITQPLNNGSVINDAITANNDYTYVTGKRSFGVPKTGKNLFLLAFDEMGVNYFRDSIITGTSSGNMLAYNPGGASVLAVTGFTNNLNPLVLPNYGYTTRFYSNQIDRVATQKTDQKVNVYPNPFTDVITIESSNPVIQVSIIDIIGKVVYSKQSDADFINEGINLNFLQPGVYFLRLNNSEPRKIVKQ